MVHGTRRNAKKMRNLRCKSADSGVSCTLNKNLLQQDVVQSSRLEINGTGVGLDEEDLDFEPELSYGTEEESRLPINSDESTVKVLYSNSRDMDGFSNASVENSIASTISIGHRRDMIPLPRSDAKDRRESEYLPSNFSSITTRTLIDSSSDDASSDSDTDDNGTRLASEGDLSRDQNVSYSGDLDRDDNESMCDISQEEEERLLSSDDETYIEREPAETYRSDDVVDEDEEPPHTESKLTENHHSKEEPYLEKRSVESCVFGNARITFPTFVKKTPAAALRPMGNDLKRTTSTVRSHKMQTKKKRKWDLRYTPEEPPTRLFLEDIGFVAESSPDEDREDNSSRVDNSSREDSSSGDVRVPQLIVICNDKDKVVREGTKSEMQREILQVSKNDGDLFKLPLLPPPKRPPTRPKRSVFNNENFTQNLQIKVSNKDAGPAQPDSSFVAKESNFFRAPCNFQDENKSNKFDIVDKDDIISIIASTIDDNNEDTSGLDPFNLEIKESSFYEFESLASNKPEPALSRSFTEERVQNWVQNMPDPRPLSSIQPPSIQQEVMQPQYGESTVKVMPPSTAKGNNRIYFGDVPFLFNGLCYHYFFNGICVKKCNLLHSVNRTKYVTKFKQSSPEQLSDAYKFVLPFEKLFEEIYPCFLEAFAYLKMQKNLVASIEDIFRMESIDNVEGLELIVKNLEVSGLSLLEATEMICFNFGFLKYPELADILLDLLTRKLNMSENWDVIKRISKARGQISPDIVKRMLINATSVYPLDKHLCLEIYNVIIRNKMTDLTQIGEEHLAPLRTLAEFRDTAEAAMGQVATAVSRQVAKSVSNTSLIRPMAIPHNTELLAAHIDNNLIKERERYERGVEGRTVSLTTIPIRPHVLERPYINSYDFDARNVVTHYDNLHHGSDSDDRYFTPKQPHESFLSRDSSFPNNRYGNTPPFQGGGMFSVPSSSLSNDSQERNTASPPEIMTFEPPVPLEVSRYVPETVQRLDIRNRSPVFQSGQNNLPTLRHEDLDITLTPSRPIFGNPRYRSNFTLDKTLHNLLPDSSEHVSINERDIVVLDDAIKSKDGTKFYRLLQQYKSPATLRSFITMTIAHLKNCSGPFEALMGLVESLEAIKVDYAKDRLIKAMVEVVVMNLLFELERRGFWFKARKLLEKFCDWDSLISSQIFAKRSITTMGRYIFLAKIFSKSQNFHYTYEILQCPSLHLLESCDRWPYFYNAQADVEQRNVVLGDFFKHGYRTSIADVCDMYRRIYKYGGIHGYDAHSLFNPTLITLMNENQISKLKYFHPDIDIYYKVMDKNVLRAFTILLSTQLNQDELFRLYELCCERQIYMYFQGGESNITIRNNMLDIELQLILNYYFYKIMSTRRLPAGHLIISIKLLESQVHSPKILQTCCRSISAVNDSVKRILRDTFNIVVCDSTNGKFTDVEIRPEQLEDWLRGKEGYYGQGYW